MKFEISDYKKSIEITQTVRTGFSAEMFSATVEIKTFAEFDYNGQSTRDTSSYALDVVIWKKTAKGEIMYEGHGLIRVGEEVPSGWYFHKKISGREYSASNSDLPISELNAYIRTLDIPTLLTEETIKSVQTEIEKLERQFIILNSFRDGFVNRIQEGTNTTNE